VEAFQMADRTFSALVIGGAGFIGSHLVDALVTKGHRTRILDNLLEQAHPRGPPDWLNSEAEFVEGDLRDRATVERALEGIDVIFHQGGIVGNGQSMFDIRRYIDINSVGTANLIEALLARKDQIRRVVVASSMVVYGDGAYLCPHHGRLSRVSRPLARLVAAKWEPVCLACGAEVAPLPTPEDHTLAPTSTYGISKRDQEELSLVHGRANGLPTIALRYLNVYGSRQALSNPYTGVAAIIATRLLHRKPPTLFEDGQQRRDFCHVSDVVEANLAAATAPEEALYKAYNIGTGHSVTVLELSQMLAVELAREDIPLSTSCEFREGDIRHCFADVSMAKRLLNWEARVTLRDGIAELARWASAQNPIDYTDEANSELRARGLIRRAAVRLAEQPTRSEG
jgi:dTDP-L-rhamnose 4-epimerase